MGIVVISLILMLACVGGMLASQTLDALWMHGIFAIVFVTISALYFLRGGKSKKFRQIELINTYELQGMKKDSIYVFLDDKNRLYYLKDNESVYVIMLAPGSSTFSYAAQIIREKCEKPYVKQYEKKSYSTFISVGRTAMEYIFYIPENMWLLKDRFIRICPFGFCRARALLAPTLLFNFVTLSEMRMA